MTACAPSVTAKGTSFDIASLTSVPETFDPSPPSRTKLPVGGASITIVIVD